MSPIRLFSPIPLHAGQKSTLDAVQSRYLVRALRLRAGDSFTMFDGRGGEFPATIISADRTSVAVETGEKIDRDIESPLILQLIQGISKGDRMDAVVQKATELGANLIVPVTTDYSVVKLIDERARNRREHWQKIAQSACEQCGRNTVPTIDAPLSLTSWFGIAAKSNATQVILRPEAQPAMTTLENVGNRITIVVGPEGGVSPAEIARADAAGLQSVSLGPRILRTETAALAAVSVAQACWGDARSI